MIFNLVSAFCRKFLGIELERQTNLVAFAALLLSILAAGIPVSYFIYGSIKGAKVDLFSVDDRVLIKKEPMGDKDYVAISETVAFWNSGEIGYDTAVKKVTITLKFSGKEYGLKWHEFVTFEKKENDQLKKGSAETAVPLQITAGNILSKDIYFAPFRKRCEDEKDNCNEWGNYLTWEKFLKKLKRGEKIDFTITAKLLDDNVSNSSCTVDIDQHLINSLRKNGWHSPSCY